MSIAIKYWAFQQTGWGQVTEPPAPEPEAPTQDGDDTPWFGIPDHIRPPLVFLDRGFITTLRLFTYVKQRGFAQERFNVGPTVIVYNSTKLTARDVQLHRLAVAFKSKISPHIYESILEKLNDIHTKANDPYYFDYAIHRVFFQERHIQSIANNEKTGTFLSTFLHAQERQQVFTKDKIILNPLIQEKSTIISSPPEGDFLTLILQALAEQGEDISLYDDIEIDFE